MRELKFKGWNNEIKKMIEPHDLYQNGIYWPKFGKRDLELMQYTGIKDKNGTEIYEGDIVLFHGQYDKKKLIEEVIFKYGSFFVAGYRIGEIFTILKNKNDVIKVIGNKYENPELLEDSQ